MKKTMILASLIFGTLLTTTSCHKDEILINNNFTEVTFIRTDTGKNPFYLYNITDKKYTYKPAKYGVSNDTVKLSIYQGKKYRYVGVADEDSTGLIPFDFKIYVGPVLISEQYDVYGSNFTTYHDFIP